MTSKVKLKQKLEEIIDLAIDDILAERLEKSKLRFSTTASVLSVIVETAQPEEDCYEFSFDSLLPKDKAQRKACLDLIKQYIEEYE